MSSRQVVGGEADTWTVPAAAPLAGKLGLLAQGLMLLLALCWWVSLLHDVWVGRTPWAAALAGGLGLGLWAWWSRAWDCRAWRRPGATAGPVLHWHDATRDSPGPGEAPMLPWCDHAGRGVHVKVVLDLGPWCLLRVAPVGAEGGAARSGTPCQAVWATFHRWIDAGELQGAWRWRVMMASSAGTTTSHSALSSTSLHRSTPSPRPGRRPA